MADQELPEPAGEVAEAGESVQHLQTQFGQSHVRLPGAEGRLRLQSCPVSRHGQDGEALVRQLDWYTCPSVPSPVTRAGTVDTFWHGRGRDDGWRPRQSLSLNRKDAGVRPQ